MLILYEIPKRTMGRIEDSHVGSYLKKINPDHLSLLNLACAMLAGVLISQATNLLALIALSTAVLFDILDGASARLRGNLSLRGYFVDSAADRVGEVAILIGFFMTGKYHPLLIFSITATILLTAFLQVFAMLLQVNHRKVYSKAERLIFYSVVLFLQALGVYSNTLFLIMAWMIVISGILLAREIFIGFSEPRNPITSTLQDETPLGSEAFIAT